jgi:hydroxyacid-oxoacid transhydrogenase
VSCAHSLVSAETAFAVDMSRIVFGPGSLDELGDAVRSLGCKRVALFTDARVAKLEHLARARTSLAGIEIEVFDGVHVEPTDASFGEAARFAREGRFDGYVSVGGGSVIDTCKAAALYATYPADFLAYVNAPVGEGQPVPGALPPHVACPTTCGTGSETTGIAVCDVLALAAKTGIASPRLRPTLALVDPTCTYTLPREVVAASGFDVLCHALESYTARAFDARAATKPRPMSQGRNPWSDMGSLRALELGSASLVRAVTDASDHAARDALSWAATLAGIAFGNAGVHVPHAMAYAVAGLVKSFHMGGYPREEALVPHGVSVVVSAPSAFRFTARGCPERHLAAARALGIDSQGSRRPGFAGSVDSHDVSPDDAGEVLARGLLSLMKDTRVPSSLGALGYGSSDVPALTKGTIVQKRLLSNAPVEPSETDLSAIFVAALA